MGGLDNIIRQRLINNKVNSAPKDYPRMTGADVIALSGQISEPVHVWARPNASAAWTLIPIPPGNARGIEYGMASWEFAGPVYPPGKPWIS